MADTEQRPPIRTELAQDRLPRSARIEHWAGRQNWRIGEINPLLVAIRVGRRFSDVRVPGLSAEMSYYALISLIPFLVAVGASFGMAERIIGVEQVQEIEDGVIRGLQQVFSPELTNEVLGPLVQTLLYESRTGVAILSLLVTFFLASAVFRALIRALDDAYQVPERRRGLYLWGMAYLFALGSILVLTSVLSLVVVGPLLGGGTRLAEWVGLGEAFALIWAIGRWPAVFLIAIAYLGWVFRVAPNVRNRWRQSLPGATLATIGIIFISLGLRFYLDVAGPRGPEFGQEQEALTIASQTIGALLAVILWMWLIGMAVLTGGLLNAEIRRDRDPRSSRRRKVRIAAHVKAWQRKAKRGQRQLLGR
jgi:membrane protein